MAFFFTNMLKLLEKNLPKIVIAPAVGLISWFVYGFVLWTLYISFTNSKILPKYELWGTGQYVKLWGLRKWHIAIENLLIFTILFLLICTIIGVLLAIFLDQKIRSEGFLRTVYLYPMALSFIVTGTAWRWILNPTLGIQKLFNDWGFENFSFDWLVNREMAIYTIVIAGVWQSSGFVMAMFLAGLRSIDDEIIKAAKIDGANLFVIYSKVIIPMMRPVFFTSFVILVHISIKSYDLIVALTQGGPGISTTMPALFMTQAAFHKSQVGLAAASAMMMFMAVAAVIIPYLYSELRKENVR